MLAYLQTFHKEGVNMHNHNFLSCSTLAWINWLFQHHQGAPFGLREGRKKKDVHFSHQTSWYPSMIHMDVGVGIVNK